MKDPMQIIQNWLGVEFRPENKQDLLNRLAEKLLQHRILFPDSPISSMGPFEFRIAGLGLDEIYKGLTEKDPTIHCKEYRIISFITDDNRRFAITHFDPDPALRCWPPLEGPNAGPVYRWQVIIGKSHLTWELNQAQFTEQRNAIEKHGFRVYIVERTPLEASI